VYESTRSTLENNGKDPKILKCTLHGLSTTPGDREAGDGRENGYVEASMAGLTAGVLGPRVLERDGRPQTLRRARHRALVNVLAARWPTAVTPPELAEMVWEAPRHRATSTTTTRVGRSVVAGVTQVATTAPVPVSALPSFTG
jgi:hypothetical protein